MADNRKNYQMLNFESVNGFIYLTEITHESWNLDQDEIDIAFNHNNINYDDLSWNGDIHIFNDFHEVQNFMNWYNSLEFGCGKSQMLDDTFYIKITKSPKDFS